MTMKNDAKLEEELTCRFKIDMRNLAKHSKVSKICTLMFELKKYRKVMFDGTED